MMMKPHSITPLDANDCASRARPPKQWLLTATSANASARATPQLLGAPLGPDGEKGSVLPDHLVRRLPANTLGRDFLVGPIRGAFGTLVDGMRRVGFDEASDRLICVGDLLDPVGGPLPACEFLTAPFVHAVRSRRDHEFAQLDPVEIRMIAKLPGAAFAWATKLSDRQLAAVQDGLRTLPLVLEIPTGTGIAGVLHALPPAPTRWLQLVAALDSRDGTAISSVLTESRCVRGIPTVVSDVDRVFVGHTPRFRGTRRTGNVIAMDTGTALHELAVRTRRACDCPRVRDRTGTEPGRPRDDFRTRPAETAVHDSRTSIDCVR